MHAVTPPSRPHRTGYAGLTGPAAKERPEGTTDASRVPAGRVRVRSAEPGLPALGGQRAARGGAAACRAQARRDARPRRPAARAVARGVGARPVGARPVPPAMALASAVIGARAQLSGSRSGVRFGACGSGAWLEKARRNPAPRDRLPGCARVRGTAAIPRRPRTPGQCLPGHTSGSRGRPDGRAGPRGGVAGPLRRLTVPPHGIIVGFRERAPVEGDRDQRPRGGRSWFAGRTTRPLAMSEGAKWFGGRTTRAQVVRPPNHVAGPGRVQRSDGALDEPPGWPPAR